MKDGETEKTVDDEESRNYRKYLKIASADAEPDTVRNLKRVQNGNRGGGQKRSHVEHNLNVAETSVGGRKDHLKQRRRLHICL